VDRLRAMEVFVTVVSRRSFARGRSLGHVAGQRHAICERSGVPPGYASAQQKLTRARRFTQHRLCIAGLIASARPSKKACRSRGARLHRLHLCRHGGRMELRRRTRTGLPGQGFVQDAYEQWGYREVGGPRRAWRNLATDVHHRRGTCARVGSCPCCRATDYPTSTCWRSIPAGDT